MRRNMEEFHSSFYLDMIVILFWSRCFHYELCFEPVWYQLHVSVLHVFVFRPAWTIHCAGKTESKRVHHGSGETDSDQLGNARPQCPADPVWLDGTAGKRLCLETSSRQQWVCAEQKWLIRRFLSNRSQDILFFHYVFCNSLIRFFCYLGFGCQNSMDLCKVAAMGHSFGGATVIESLCKEVKFKYEIKKNSDKQKNLWCVTNLLLVMRSQDLKMWRDSYFIKPHLDVEWRWMPGCSLWRMRSLLRSSSPSSSSTLRSSNGRGTSAAWGSWTRVPPRGRWSL